jgi:hypothetical protein
LIGHGKNLRQPPLFRSLEAGITVRFLAITGLPQRFIQYDIGNPLTPH